MSNHSLIKKRAALLALTRQFFAERSVLEVDTNLLHWAAPVDAHIDVMEVNMGAGKTGYLHTSPEYAMKKLLAAGSGDIYQLSHVFRAGEEGKLHAPEFTMLEWYRHDLDYTAFIDETLDLIRLFIGPCRARILSYRQALIDHARLDYTAKPDLYTIAKDLNLPITTEAKNWDEDTLLTLLFSHIVEPKLGQDELTVITDYPPSQAALAKTTNIDQHLVARRYEIYYKGVELANGYDELTDASEQEERFHEENEMRITMGKRALPIDTEFLDALRSGMPDCRGVAVGFDRLVMLHLNLTSLPHLLPPKP